MIYKLITLRFMSLAHQAIHDLLLERGFSFEVSSLLQVGVCYSHPKRLQARVSVQDDECWVTLYNIREIAHATPQVIADHSYSANEWDWLDAARDDVVEFLRRELIVHLDIRPYYMIRPPY